MDAKFSSEVSGYVSSAIHPLFYSMVLINELMQDHSDNLEKYNRILCIDQQIQRAIEKFLELRSATVMNYGSNLMLFNSDNYELEKKPLKQATEVKPSSIRLKRGNDNL